MKLDMRKKQEKKETTKSTKKLPMTAKMKRAMAVYIAMVLIMTAGASTVFAADDPLTVINNLSTFIFGLIRAIGMILLGIWNCAGWFITEISRSKPESQWILNISRWCHYYICKRNPESDYRLRRIERKKKWDGAGPNGATRPRLRQEVFRTCQITG